MTHRAQCQFTESLDEAILDNQKKFNENSGLPPFHSMFGNREDSDSPAHSSTHATHNGLTIQLPILKIKHVEFGGSEGQAFFRSRMFSRLVCKA